VLKQTSPTVETAAGGDAAETGTVFESENGAHGRGRCAGREKSEMKNRQKKEWRLSTTNSSRNLKRHFVPWLPSR
jgi:hypothetical protein